jgi:hypothetical protein
MACPLASTAGTASRNGRTLSTTCCGDARHRPTSRPKGGQTKHQTTHRLGRAQGLSLSMPDPDRDFPSLSREDQSIKLLPGIQLLAPHSPPLPLTPSTLAIQFPALTRWQLGR